MSSIGRQWSLKIIIMGDPSVGKTSLRRAFLGEKFQVNYISTIGADFSFKQIKIGDDEINSSIWDLAGQESFGHIRPQYYRGSAGALIVYDITNEESYHNITKWIEKYQSLTGSGVPIMVVGNKIDLLEEGHEGITKEEQGKFVESLRERFDHRFPIMSTRTSAKNGIKINESFERLVKRVLEWQREKTSDPDKSEETPSDHIRAVYLLGFHDALGPQILNKTPGEPNEHSDKEFSSTIKISSVLDFQDVANNSQIIGSTPWTDPVGTMNYIAFTIDNENARGKKSLFIIGFVANRDIREPISQNKNIIDGYLHNVMNNFVRTMNKHDVYDLTSQNSDEKETQKIIDSFSDNLKQLQMKIFEVIRNDI